MIHLKDVSVCLTSELMFNTTKIYYKELSYRADKVMNLTLKQLSCWRHLENKIFQYKYTRISNETYLVYYDLLKQLRSRKKILFNLLSSSELVLWEDFSTFLYAQGIETFSELQRDTISSLAVQCGNCIAQQELKKRFIRCKIPVEKVGIFVLNEKLLLQQFLWGYTPSSIAWLS